MEDFFEQDLFRKRVVVSLRQHTGCVQCTVKQDSIFQWPKDQIKIEALGSRVIQIGMHSFVPEKRWDWEIATSAETDLQLREQSGGVEIQAESKRLLQPKLRSLKPDVSIEFLKSG